MDSYFLQRGILPENNGVDGAADAREGVGLPAGVDGAFTVALSILQKFSSGAVDAQAQAQLHRHGKLGYLIVLQVERRLAIKDHLVFVEFDAALETAVIDINVGAGIDTAVGKSVYVIMHTDTVGLVVERYDDDVGMAPRFRHMLVGPVQILLVGESGHAKLFAQDKLPAHEKKLGVGVLFPAFE